MSKLQIIIGADTSIDTTEDGYTGGNSVAIEANNGTVCVVGPDEFGDWMGYQQLADFDSPDEGEALARKIAANPVAELTALGYDCADWFKPLSA